MSRASRGRTHQAIATRRRFPIGAEVVADGLVHFRVWAPAAQRVEIILGEGLSCRELRAEGQGYFSDVIEARAGDCYQFRLNESPQLYPDPASRFQPRGPHRASEIVDRTSYQWSDEDWPGADLKGQSSTSSTPAPLRAKGHGRAL
jgi:maltooligosyltrehalose trehalohydrolase